MNLLAILGGIFLTITSFFSVPKATTQTQKSVLAVEATPTDIPVPTEIPPTETPIPTIKIWPTKIPVTPTPDTRIDDLQKQVNDLKKQVNPTSTPKSKYLCQNTWGTAIYSNDPCPPTPTGYCIKTENGVSSSCN